MVQQKESVVTPERYAKGQTYAEYTNSIERNQQRDSLARASDEQEQGDTVGDQIAGERQSGTSEKCRERAAASSVRRARLVGIPESRQPQAVGGAHGA